MINASGLGKKKKIGKETNLLFFLHLAVRTTYRHQPARSKTLSVTFTLLAQAWFITRRCSWCLAWLGLRLANRILTILPKKKINSIP